MRRGRGYGAEVLLRLPERGRVSRLARVHAVVEHARVRRRVRAVGLGPAPHPEPGQRAYRLGGGYSVGGRFHYNTGRPYPVDGEYLRLPAFWQIDLRADKRMVFDRSTWDIYIELGNATFNEQVTAYSAPMIGNPGDPGTDHPRTGGLPHRAAVDWRARRVVSAPKGSPSATS